MGTIDRETSQPRGRWIRPVDCSEDPTGRAPSPAVSADRVQDPEGTDRPTGGVTGIEEILAGEALERLRRLATLERELEDRIRLRWKSAEAEIHDIEERSERDLSTRERRAQVETQEARREAQREGRADGFREGFEKGTEEGRRLGLEKGRIDGAREGRSSGRSEEIARTQGEASKALEALRDAIGSFGKTRERLLREVRENVVLLAVRIAEKVIQREVRLEPRVILGNVEKAVEQIFRGCDITLQLHPRDASFVEEVLGENPRWAEDMKIIQLRPASDVARGGCRLLSGAGVVDLSVESQLELIEDALLRSVAGFAEAEADDLSNDGDLETEGDSIA